jgi:hypothetical protein
MEMLAPSYQPDSRLASEIMDKLGHSLQHQIEVAVEWLQVGNFAARLNL